MGQFGKISERVSLKGGRGIRESGNWGIGEQGSLGMPESGNPDC